MSLFTAEFLSDLGMDDTLAKVLAIVFNILIIAAICVAVYFVIKLISFIIKKASKTANTKFIVKCAAEHQFTEKISWFFIAIIIGGFAGVFPKVSGIISKISTYVSIILLMVITDCIVKIVCDFYATKSISKKRPIKGILQITEILIFLVFGIIMISLLINQSPLVLIGGIGTFTAILSIVFKDALLGLVAGVQITADDLLRIGDWVEIPSQGVEGTVQDISLITVKILAFDNTLFTIPAYTFLSVPFRNWHTAINGKARRINRTVSFDVRSVRPMTDSEINTIVKKYNYEDLNPVIEQAKTNSGSITNLAMFRELITRRIKEDSNICKDKLVVCQIEDKNGSTGIPVDFICFTSKTDWVDYSKVSASKMDLALYLANELGLNVYQSKSDFS